MEENLNENIAGEPAAELTYGMSAALRGSGLLGKVNSLSHEDKTCLIRYIRLTDDQGQNEWEDLADESSPYSMEELNARIDVATSTEELEAAVLGDGGRHAGEGVQVGELAATLPSDLYREDRHRRRQTLLDFEVRGEC